MHQIIAFFNTIAIYITQNPVMTIHVSSGKLSGQKASNTIPQRNTIRQIIGLVYEIFGRFNGLYGKGFWVVNTTGAPHTSILSSISHCKERQGKTPCLLILFYFVNFFSRSIAFAACKLCSKRSLFLIENV